MHGPGHNLKTCKLMHAQSKAMKLTWSTTCGGIICCVQFQGANKCPTKVQELNALVANELKEVIKKQVCKSYG